MVDKKIFKKYLDKDVSYVGGKALSEIKTKAEKIYKLSSNENPLGASPKAIEAIQRAVNNIHIYPDRTDIRLRQALVKFYQEEAFTEDNFLCANAGCDVLDMICRAFLTEESHCIICSPCFAPYKMFSSWYGAAVSDIRLKDETYKVDFEAMLNEITPQTRLIFLTSPNNPTGSYIPKSELISFLDRLPDHIVVVYDEVYYHFAEAEDFCHGIDLVKSGYNVVCLNSFSKTYGLAALRLGYVYGDKTVMNYIRNLARPFIINQLSIEAGIAALEDTEFINDVVSLVRNEKKYLYQELDKLGITYWMSEANFILIDPPIQDLEMIDRLLDHGIMARPVANFGAPGKVRVSVGTREANEIYIKALQSIVG